MRTVMLAVLVVAILPACATRPTAGTAPNIPLRGADCLDPASARSWHEVSSTEIRVDAGRRKYRLTLAGHCNLLAQGPEIVLAGDPASGRICGRPGDALVTRDGERCRIERIELIDAETWDESGDRAKAAAGAIVR